MEKTGDFLWRECARGRRAVLRSTPLGSSGPPKDAGSGPALQKASVPSSELEEGAWTI